MTHDELDERGFTRIEQGEHGPDHWIIQIGRDEGEDGFAPIAIVDDLFESEEYATDPEVIARAVEDVLSANRILGGYTPVGRDVADARADQSIRFRIYAINAVSETNYTLDKGDAAWDAPCPDCGAGPIALKGHGGECPNGHILSGV